MAKIISDHDPFDPIAHANYLQQQVHTFMSENHALKEALKEARQQNWALSQCRSFDILTQPALEQEWQKIAVGHPCFSLIYFDLDDLKGLNRQHGITGVNQKIKTALNCVRESEIVGRAFHGDEFVVIVQGSQVHRVHERLQASFARQGISFTSAIGQCFYVDLWRNLEALVRDVEQQKNARARAAAA